MAELKIGIGLPAMGEIKPLGIIGGVGAAARHVEEFGLDSVWAPDLIIGDGTPSLESTVALAAAAVTDRVHDGFSVLVLPLRPVAWVAAQIATLQHVSATASSSESDRGGPARERGRMTDAALEVLPQLIAGEPARLEHETDRPVSGPPCRPS